MATKQVFRFAPTLVAAAYASGDVMGTAVIQIQNLLDDPGGSALIDSLGLQSKISTVPDLEVHFFCASVSPGADNAAFTLSAADLAKWVGMVKLTASTDQSGTVSGGVVAMKSNIKQMITSKQVSPTTGVRNRDIFAVVVARGAFTAVSASDLTFLLGVEQG